MKKQPTSVKEPEVPAAEEAQEAKATGDAKESKPAEAEAKADAAPASDEKKDDKKKWHHSFTWERTFEITKLSATVWVALIGTICTMQYNERQHELNRIEAIAKVLPHLSSSSDKGDGSEMARDGAIWAAFRIANNKVMLRDLAALYPEDIYRVVSSIAAADGLEHDSDALTALEVASEKLASKYANDEKRQQLSVRLLEQSMRIRQHLNGDKSPLNIVDLSTANDYPVSPEQTADVMEALNKLGKMHLTNSQSNDTVGTERSRGRQLFVRARQIGISAKNRTPSVMRELIAADQNLADLLRTEGKMIDADAYSREAQELGSNKAVDKITQLQLQHMERKMSEMDADGDGKVSLQEMKQGLKQGIITSDEFKQWQTKFAKVDNIPIDKPTVTDTKN